MVRFLHSADWQLGMRRHFLDADAQARFSDARIEAIRAAGRIAGREGCSFMVVAGDVFESNHVDRRTVARALDALAGVPVPVYLLPGNHDPLDAASVYSSPAFTASCPSNVHVITGDDRREVAPGVDVVGVPWPSKRPASDLVGATLAALDHRPGREVVLVAHGAVADGVFGLSSTAISLARLEAALHDRRIAYVALGDRHSTTSVGTSDRVWYSGAPEPTDFDETDPGNVLVVELDGDSCRVQPHHIATWTFHRESFDVTTAADVDGLDAMLTGLARKDRTIVRLGLRGTVNLEQHTRLTAALDRGRELLASLDSWEPNTDLLVVPDDDDLANVDVTGFARTALERLVAQTRSGSPDAAIARDALALLHRLAS